MRMVLTFEFFLSVLDITDIICIVMIQALNAMITAQIDYHVFHYFRFQ